MRSLLLIGAILLPSASAATTSDRELGLPKPLEELGLRADCPEIAPHHSIRSGEPLMPRKLAELPPAKAYHAVLKSAPDGCLDPVYVGYQYRQQR